MGNCCCYENNVVSLIEICKPVYAPISYYIEEKTGRTIYDCLKSPFEKRTLGESGYKLVHYFDDYGNKFSNNNRISTSVFIGVEPRVIETHFRLYLIINCHKSDINMHNIKRFFDLYVPLMDSYQPQPYVHYTLKLQGKYYSFADSRYCNKSLLSLLNEKNRMLINNFIGFNSNDSIISRSSIANILRLFGASYGYPKLNGTRCGSKRIVGETELIEYYSNIPLINIIIEDGITDYNKQKFVDNLVKQCGAKKYSLQVKNAISNRIKFVNINDVLSVLYTVGENYDYINRIEDVIKLI